MRSFGQRWEKQLAGKSLTDYGEKLRRSFGQECNKTSSDPTVDPCELPQHPEVLTCDLETFEKLDGIRRSLDWVLQQRLIAVSWIQNREELPLAAKRYILYADFLARRCSLEVYERVKLDQSWPYTQIAPLATLFDLEKDCRRSKYLNLQNPNVKREDVSSLECTIELIRRLAHGHDKSNIMLNDKTLARLRKIMTSIGAKLGLSLSLSKREGLFESILNACEKYTEKEKPLFQAALLHQSIVLSDDYFYSIPVDDPYFDSLKAALICKTIGENSSMIKEKIGTRVNIITRLLFN